jgi:molybdate transport system substrate-binding protein
VIRRLRESARPLLVVILLGGASLAGCGATKAQLEVSAAASLQRAFTRYAQQFHAADTRFSFAGSDALAAQIEQGARPAVFASANTQLPEMLFAKGLVEKPVVFASNRLVLAVAASSRIVDLAGIERPGVRIALGSAGVPVGDYSAKLLARLPAPQRAAVLANVRDREPDVTGIVGKLTEGAVDAGLLYATDVSATDGELRAIELPRSLQPAVAYAAAVVKGAAAQSQARAFIAGLLRGRGRQDLLSDGFRAPPVP